MKNKKTNLNKVAGGGFLSKAFEAGKQFAKSETGKKLIGKGIDAGKSILAKKTGMDDWD